PGYRQVNSIPAPGTILCLFSPMYYTYVIKSLPKNYIYIGITDNLKRRLNQHNLGYNKTTKPYAPFILIFYKS
ncbi:MAG TPA: GIY-YIG nuclease family protein, partial [Bacteroidia bacterium]|nr:GIY-YIG nuclease family protein [Bacteroidia bacterium]